MFYYHLWLGPPFLTVIMSSFPKRLIISKSSPRRVISFTYAKYPTVD